MVIDPSAKIAPEGVEALKEVSGSADRVLAQLIGGIQAGLGYVGAANLDSLHQKSRFIRITNAGLIESHPHSVIVTKEAPNYQVGQS